MFEAIAPLFTASAALTLWPERPQIITDLGNLGGIVGPALRWLFVYFLVFQRGDLHWVTALIVTVIVYLAFVALDFIFPNGLQSITQTEPSPDADGGSSDSGNDSGTSAELLQPSDDTDVRQNPHVAQRSSANPQ